ncbi:MAG: precorrin-4 C(11)-methyltransferase [Candidatus Desulfaltia sp.]|nr:precorrin-4 C(11)-methyltransferase [Candidatus Desulfaltia sp.]
MGRKTGGAEPCLDHNRNKGVKMEGKQKNPVLFVGAGPGDPELITVKGMKALQEADLIIYAGSLVPEKVLAWARPETRKINSAGLDLETIVFEMVDAHGKGKKVVRLHTGDPGLYGAIQEQIAELERERIPFKIIPGVTAAFAAAAAMGQEFTIPEISQSLIFTRVAGRTPVPEDESLEKLASHKTSMAIYLSVSKVEEVCSILGKCYGKTAPAVVAYRVSQPEEKIIRTSIGDMADRIGKENIKDHAIIIVGKFLDASVKDLKKKSKLYDRNFSHKYRKP